MSLGDNGQNTEDVYARVREAILDGELAPGAVMSQVAVAGELGISRTPLREALRMLQSERLVEAEPNRRVRVAPMSAADLEELCIVRIALEAGPVGDRGASRDPRCVRGGGPGPEREPPGQPSGPHRLRGRGAARARL
jgi:DNA-binding GntR family transcriptional regulator